MTLGRDKMQGHFRRQGEVGRKREDVVDQGSLYEGKGI